MGFVVLGVLFLLLKLVEIGPVATWNFEFTGDLWKFVAPFVAALVWWWVMDVTGTTRRREIAKENERTAQRREERAAMLNGKKR